MEQTFAESGIGTLKDLKRFYVNDIINYYQQTYRKVTHLYEAYKVSKEQRNRMCTSSATESSGSGGRSASVNNNGAVCGSAAIAGCVSAGAGVDDNNASLVNYALKCENDLKLEELMKANDLYTFRLSFV